MIVIAKEVGLTIQEHQKLAMAMGLANRVGSDSAFRFGIQATPSFSNTSDNGNQVWDKIEGAKLNINVTVYDLPWYKRWSSEVAREMPDGIGIRRSYFDTASLADLVDTAWHELMHHPLGFIHDFWATARRPDSVPYKVGSLAGAIARKLLLQPSAPKVEVESVTAPA